MFDSCVLYLQHPEAWTKAADPIYRNLSIFAGGRHLHNISLLPGVCEHFHDRLTSLSIIALSVPSYSKLVTSEYFEHGQPKIRCIYYNTHASSEAAFASIMVITIGRGIYLSNTYLLDHPFEKQRNKEVARMQWQGIAMFASSA